MAGDKSLTVVRAVHSSLGVGFDGYEIHIGQTRGPDCARPFAKIGDRRDGATSADGRVQGSYLHGMFSDDDFRSAYLAGLGARSSKLEYGAGVDRVLDDLAAHMEAHLDLDGLFSLAN